METVREIFTEEDAHIISCIHISNVQMHDRLIWKESESGEFSVKTGYCMAMKVLGKVVSTEVSWKGVWRIIWKASVAPKVKYFAWRFLHGFLPVWSILISRGVHVQNSCCMCGTNEETLCHVFLYCRYSRGVWQLFSQEVWQYMESRWCPNEGWESLIFWLKEKDAVEDWLYVLWCIWNNRNQCLHKLSCQLPTDLVRYAGRMKAEFCSELTRSGFTNPESLDKWRKPPVGCFKLNVDAAFFSDHKVARLGMVVRDARGEILWCAVKKGVQAYSPLQAELKAILFGLEEISGSNLQVIEVESDSLLAIKEVENTNHSSCEWEGISMDIRICAQTFLICRFLHIKRDSNMLAHRIASMTNILGDYKAWKLSLPESICNPDSEI